MQLQPHQTQPQSAKKKKKSRLCREKKGGLRQSRKKENAPKAQYILSLHNRLKNITLKLFVQIKEKLYFSPISFTGNFYPSVYNYGFNTIFASQ
jgi:hypothetical protein